MAAGGRRPFREDWTAFLLLALTPLTVFLHHHDYPGLRPEVLLIVGGLALVAAAAAAATSRGGAPVRLPLTVVLLTLAVDVQTDWITTWGLRLLLTVTVAALVCWLLRRVLGRTVILLAGTVLLSTLLLPAPGPLARREGSAARVGDPALPPLIHLILDEQIGIEGIPAEFDPTGALAAELRDFYVDRGFRVFGRAYSRYYQTFEALPNLFNFTALDLPAAYFAGGFAEGKRPTANAWFARLREQGYRLTVLQSDYLPLAADDSARVLTYQAQALRSLDRLPLGVPTKAHHIWGTYGRLSFLLERGRRTWARWRETPAGRRLPAWDRIAEHVTPVSARAALASLRAELTDFGPGQAVVLHLLLPHSPYVYAADCTARTPLGDWLSFNEPRLRPRQNDDASRTLRYPLYLEQVRCTEQLLGEWFDDLRRRGIWERALVVVHGDHGSRIDRGPPKGETVAAMAPQDYTDAFSTLFAVKLPGVESGYDRRLLPLDRLFTALVRDGADPGDAGPEAPAVFLYPPRERLERRALPPFARDLP